MGLLWGLFPYIWSKIRALLVRNLQNHQIKRRSSDLHKKENFKPDLSNTLDKPLAAISSAFLEAFDWVNKDFSVSGISFSFISSVTSYIV